MDIRLVLEQIGDAKELVQSVIEHRTTADTPGDR
jgi:hypothetical protein